MYEASFGLNVPPFRLVPDPNFYLEDGQYGTILAKLIDGLEAAQPCLLLTGPAGSGKTAAAQRLRVRLDHSRWTVGTMFASTGGDAQGALHAAVQAFGLATADTQPGPALDAWLSTQAARGGRVLLIVDEAQHLEDGALRQLAERLVPAGDTPRLQLCLVGEHVPAALAGAVRDGSLPPVAVHCRLRPLDASETRDYVLHRLRCAGWTGRPAFDRAATDAIHRRSEGIPRRMHLLADRVLLQLSIDGTDVATAAAVEAADEQRTVELQGLMPIEAEVRAPVPMDTLVWRTPSIEALLAGIASTSHARPRSGTPPDQEGEASLRVEPEMPPLPLAPDDFSAGSATVAPAGESPWSPESAVLPGTRSARAVSAEARRPSIGPAAGALVFAVAVIGIGWWLSGEDWPLPTGAADSAELERMRQAVIASGRRASGTVAEPAGELAAPADTATPAAQTAPSTTAPTTQPPTRAVGATSSAPGAEATALPLEAREPAPAGPATPSAPAVDATAPPWPASDPASVIAAPAPVAGPTPSESPASAAPSWAAETARTGPGEALPTAPRPSASDPAISASLGGDGTTTGELPLDGSGAAAAAPADGSGPAAAAPPDARLAGEPPPPGATVSVAPASPTPATCTGAAAVLGLCEPAGGVAPVTPTTTRSPMPSPQELTAPPAADAVSTADAVPSEPPSATPLAAPCEPNRAALGLCER